MWRLVDNLDAKDPKMFPLIPIAPGIKTKSPGNVSRKKVILPKIIPAIKSPIAQALQGRKAGDVVTVRVPAGTMQLRIESVSL